MVLEIKTNSDLLTGILALKEKDSTVAVETDTTLQLKAAGISVQFNKTGRISQVTGNHGDKMSFGNGPVMVGGQGIFKKQPALPRKRWFCERSGV